MHTLIAIKKKINRSFLSLALSASVITLSACGGSSNNDAPNVATDIPDNVVDAAVEAGNFTTLVEFLTQTGLDATLANADGEFTLFAPTDEVFEQIGEEALQGFLQDPAALEDLLLYHVIGGQTLDAAAATSLAGTAQETTNGDDLAISLCGETLCINTAMVIETDLEAENGVIHVIDSVLIPPAERGVPDANIVEAAIAAGNFSTLVSALQTADLVSTLENEEETFTVFAPTDDAFALLPEETLAALLADVPALTNVLLQHVVAGVEVDSITALTLNGTSVETLAGTEVTLDIVGGALEVQGAAVSTFDIFASNGVIHVIDAVITEAQ